MRDNSDLYAYIKKEYIESGEKLKGNYPPISIRNENQVCVFPLKKIYKLTLHSPYLYLFILKNNIRQPKLRFFLAIIFAHQSSDFLVQIASDFAKNQDFHLLQYAIHPKTNRVNLLGLKELENKDRSPEIMTLLNRCRSKFRIKLKKLSFLL